MLVWEVLQLSRRAAVPGGRNCAEEAQTAATDTRDFGIAPGHQAGNLYELDGAWLIGDFGLIAVPEASGLTVDGRQVRPTAW
jgi:hypothetical protein